MYYTSIASIITPHYFKTCLYHDEPLSGRQRVGRSLKPSLVAVVTVQRSLFTHAGCSDAVSCRYSCFGEKSLKSQGGTAAAAPPPSVLWYCWLGLLTCKNRLPYNLYCVGGDVKHCSIHPSIHRWNHGIICVILAVLTRLRLIKTLCILSSKLRGR